MKRPKVKRDFKIPVSAIIYRTRYVRLVQIAEKDQITLSSLIRGIIDQYIAEQGG